MRGGGTVTARMRTFLPHRVRGDESTKVEIDLAGREIVKYSIFEIEVHHLGDRIYWGQGGERSTIEDALRVMCEVTSDWHSFPEEFTLKVTRLVNATPQFPMPE